MNIDKSKANDELKEIYVDLLNKYIKLVEDYNRLKEENEYLRELLKMKGGEE